MLKNISKIISPDLLKVLCEMGHGDEIVLADANYPAESNGQRVIRADGISIVDLLKAILELFPLDTYAEKNVYFMEVVKGDNYVPVIWNSFKEQLKKDKAFKLGLLTRFDFYERSKKAYAIVASGETALYSNVILKKGCI